MFTYNGGHKAGKGTYWNILSGLRVDLEAEGMLPGENKGRYLKVSPLVMLLLGPIIGFAYVVFLPIIGIVTVLAMLIRKMFGGLFNLGKNIVSFGWRPTEAYLAGKNKKKGNGRRSTEQSETK